jgi:hypothetical protein
MALLVLWIFCLPAGFVVLVALRLHRAKASGHVSFRRPRDAGSWSAYITHVRLARGDPARLIHPATVHSMLRAAFGAGGAICSLLALQAATSSETRTAVVLAVVASVLGITASQLPGKFGRRVVVALTNRLASVALRPPCRYIIDPVTAAITCEQLSQPTKTRNWNESAENINTVTASCGLVVFVAWIQVFSDSRKHGHVPLEF